MRIKYHSVYVNLAIVALWLFGALAHATYSHRNEARTRASESRGPHGSTRRPHDGGERGQHDHRPDQNGRRFRAVK